MRAASAGRRILGDQDGALRKAREAAERGLGEVADQAAPGFAYLVRAPLPRLRLVAAAGAVIGGGEHGRGQRLHLVGDRHLRVGMRFGDALLRLAEQARGAEHLEIRVDERGDLLLAVLRQDGEAGAQFRELPAGFLHRDVEPGDLLVHRIGLDARAADLDLRLAGAEHGPDGDAVADRNAGEHPFAVRGGFFRRRSPGIGLERLSPAH